MTELACPFCGDPHPAGDDEDADFVDEPGCRHWIGRRDPDAGLEGALEFLDGVEFDPWEPSDDVDPWEQPSEPDGDALQAAFGAYRDVAVATYSEGFDTDANGVDLLEALIDQLGIRKLEISGLVGDTTSTTRPMLTSRSQPSAWLSLLSRRGSPR